jgi:hypothetical protein
MSGEDPFPPDAGPYRSFPTLDKTGGWHEDPTHAEIMLFDKLCSSYTFAVTRVTIAGADVASFAWEVVQWRRLRIGRR